MRSIEQEKERWILERTRKDWLDLAWTVLCDLRCYRLCYDAVFLIVSGWLWNNVPQGFCIKSRDWTLGASLGSLQILPSPFDLTFSSQKKWLAPRLPTNYSENLKTLFASSLGVSVRAEVAQPGRALDSLPILQWGRSWRPSCRRFKPCPRHHNFILRQF